VLLYLLDFSRVEFEKQIALGIRKKVHIETKWPLVPLAEVVVPDGIKNGGTPDTDNTDFWRGGTICWATLVDTKSKYLYDTQRKITPSGLKHCNLLPVDSVIFSSRATIGEVCINKVPTATNQGYKSFICDKAKIHHEYLYYLLTHLRKTFEELIPPGSKYKEINGKAISEFKIPLPPLDSGIQQKIVSECLAVDNSASKLIAKGTPLNDVEETMASLRADVFKRHL
jgi:type I restriction enzyme M protein